MSDTSKTVSTDTPRPSSPGVNKRAKQRLIGVTILIVVVVGALIGFGGFLGGRAQKVSVAQVLTDAELLGKQVELTGKVVAGSWVSGAMPFTFDIEDAEDAAAGRVRIVTSDQIPGSFGDGTMATVVGIVGEDGVIEAKYPVVTKCPSKYESATGALTVTDVLSRAEQLSGTTMKVAGIVVAGSVASDPGAPIRFEISETRGGKNPLPVGFGGGLPDEFEDGTKVVITGSIEANGVFQCTEVAIEKSE